MHCPQCDFPNDVPGHEEWACAHCGTEHEPSLSPATRHPSPAAFALLSSRVDQLEARLAKIVHHRPPPLLSPDADKTVLRLVSERTLIPARLIRSEAKHTPLVQARWLAWSLLRSRFGWTFPQIAKNFGVCHGSVMHGIAKLPAERDQSRHLALVCKLIEADLDQILNPETTA